MDNLFTNKKINLYCALIFITYLFTIYTYDGTTDPVQVGSLGVLDILLICVLNFLIFNFLLLTSFVGLPLLFTVSFVNTVVGGALVSGIPNNVYFYSSISHGVLELILYYYLFSFTLEIFRAYWKDYKGYSTFYLKNLTIDFYKKEYYKCIIMIIVASIFEVLVSNAFLVYLV